VGESPSGVSARNSLVATQVVFFTTVAVCEMIAHNGQAELYGISYFGVHAPTLPIIAVGYCVGALGMWRAARYLATRESPQRLVASLRLVALMLPLELLTPFNHGSFFNWAHMGIGVVIGVTQMGIGTALAVRERRTWTTIVFLVQFGGGLCAALSLPDWGFNHMLESEVAFELGFSASLVLWTNAVGATTSMVASH